MAFRPPKGVRPPQLEGKRTGRPKGSRNWRKGWDDLFWGYLNAENRTAMPPTAGAALWQAFAASFPFEVHDFLKEHGAF